MLYQKAKKGNWFIFYLLILALILLVFVFRLVSGSIQPTQNTGLLIRLSKQYTMGRIFDRNKELIVQGRDKKCQWAIDQKEQAALSTLFGPELADSYASRMTVWGMIAPELFGFHDERLNLKGLLTPWKSRVGGDVQLTVDKDLQTYIAELLKKEGYSDGNVVVSDWKTGEILAAVSLPTFLPQKEEGAISNIFNKRYLPGSTIKMVLAAATLSIDPKLENFVYECKEDNHVFHTKGASCIIQI